VRWTCSRTSEDLNFLPSSSFFIQTKSWQKHQSLSDSNNLADFNNVNKEFLPENPPKKILQKNPPKKILQKKSSKKNPRKIQKIPPKNPEKIQKIFKQFLKKFLILKISNSLHRTWRLKTLSGLFKFQILKKLIIQIQKKKFCIVFN
jgi:hypothetical protein